MPTTTKTSIEWPKAGKNSQFLIMNIPTLYPSIIREALEFISNCCCYKYTPRQKKYLSFPGILRDNENELDPIVLEQLFIDPIGINGDETDNLDTKRFQSSPDDQEKIKKSSAIAKILDRVETIVNDNANKPYVFNKVSIIYSRPFGQPQGIHHDDYRDTTVIEKEGEMLSVIVALMENTKLDIKDDYDQRKTFAIPAGSMFLFSGSCDHGGSSYNVGNVRLHIEFVPKSNNPEQDIVSSNIVPKRFICPVEHCTTHHDCLTFSSKSRLYDHWHKKHLTCEGISLGKYIARSQGKNLMLCETCKKGFNSRKGLSRHRKRCKGTRSCDGDGSTNSAN